MNLKVVRKTFTERSTLGELSINGKFECFTLEDKVRAVKIKGETAIPEGIYEVVVTFSQKFKKPLPLLLKVPNFDGIRIHSGNTAADTEGCILVGQSKSPDFVGGSRLAFNALFSKIQAAMKKEKIFIEVVGGNTEDVAHSVVPVEPVSVRAGAARPSVKSGAKKASHAGSKAGASKSRKK